jgi:hypothetical protein
LIVTPAEPGVYPEKLHALLSSGENGTENPHEFLSAFMALYKLSDTSIGIQQGRSQNAAWQVRNGIVLPGREYLEGFKPVMDSHGSDLYQRFEALVIAARLRIAIAAPLSPELVSASNINTLVSNHLVEIPTQYWLDLLDSVNARNNTLHTPSAVLEICPISTQKEYMRAVRLALGKKVYDVTLALGFRNNGSLFNTEHDIRHDGQADHTEELIAYYKKLDAARMAALAARGEHAEPLFVDATYQALPERHEGVAAPVAKYAAKTRASQQPKAGGALGA